MVRLLLMIRITLRSSGLSYIAEVSDLGLVIQWQPAGNRVHVRLDREIWTGRTRGLCGDMDQQEKNDFKYKESANVSNLCQRKVFPLPILYVGTRLA